VNARRLRLRPIVTVVATASFAVTFVFAGFIGRRYIGIRLDGLLDPAAIRAVQADWALGFAIVAVLATLLVAAASFAAGTALTRALKRLRADVDALRRGEAAPPGEPPGFAEIVAIAHATERLVEEREERTRSLALQQEQLAQLVDSVSEGILQVGPAGRLVHANPAARAALGIPEDAVGRPLSAVIRNAELRQALEHAATGQPTPAAELALEDRRFLATSTPLAGAGGAVVAFVDLTEVRRLEGVRRDFVANVSHELKTPLTSIRGYVETLMTDELPQSMQRQFLEVIQNNAERLQGIVDDLLDLSRLESGGWRPEPEPVDALAVATDVWNGCADDAAARRVAFESDGERALVHADPGGLRQVFSNLYDNALRHTAAGGRIHVTIKRVPDGCRAAAPARNGHQPAGPPAAADVRVPAPACVLIEVRDNGSGIPQDALPRVFERFYRVDPARSRAEGGTGLGLSIVKHLVERMGGSVTAESELGKGTAIRIRLPAG